MVNAKAMDEGNGPCLATVIPVYNEAEHIEACLTSLLQQTLHPSKHMIMVVDGHSTDKTVELVENIIQRHQGSEWPRLQLLSNPERSVAHARNLALKNLPASVEFLIEMIGHATVDPKHLEQRMDAWDSCSEAAGPRLAAVGVRVVAHAGPVTRAGEWIEGALASPLGRSGGQFSQFSTMGPTKVPAFVMHRRDALDAVQGWDESFLTSQDSDLSMRLLKEGFVLYRHPTLEVRMHKRNTLAQWWKMGHRYGFWRTKVLLKHPSRAKWQEFLPWIGLLSTLMLFVGGSFWYWALPAVYGLVLVLSGLVHVFRKHGLSSIMGVPLCLLMLHMSFSIGLIDGLVRKGRPSSDRA